MKSQGQYCRARADIQFILKNRKGYSKFEVYNTNRTWLRFITSRSEEIRNFFLEIFCFLGLTFDSIEDFKVFV